MNRLADIPLSITPPSNAIPVGNNAGSTLSSFIGTFVGAMTIIGAIWFLFKIIMGGIAIMNSDGDKQAVATARGSITNGLIGLIVIISAVFFVELLGFIFGTGNLLDITGFLITPF